MADEANPAIVSSSKNEKIFTLKAVIVFVLALMVWTGVMFYFFKGNSGRVTVEDTHANTRNLQIFSKAVLEQSQIPPIKIMDMVVQIKLDKNGDTLKLLTCAFAFHIGLTQKEQKAIDENKWPPSLESTRFGAKDITEEDYMKETWSLKDVVMGKAAEGGGEHGGGVAKGGGDESYIGLLGSMEDELKAIILHTLMQTTYSQINTDDVKKQIVEQLKNEANALLKNLGKYPRVYKVSLITFYFQQ